MDEHGFFNCPGLAVNFLLYYTELVGVHGMACGGTVLVYGGRGLEVFLDSVTHLVFCLILLCRCWCS